MNAMMRGMGAVFLLTVFASHNASQVIDKRALSLEGARKVIEAAKGEATRLKAPGAVIAVVDDGGNLVALERLDGTFAAGANMSIDKARAVALKKRPGPLQGGVPIEVAGQVVGGVGVSGAANAQQDRDIAIAGANSLSAPSARVVPAVSYFESAKVTAGFATGTVLFDKSEKYAVHASRRDKPGVVEVHEKDADIIYVLDGSATLVTGGTVVAAKTVAPGEIRGVNVQGGETRRIAKGDVIIVPAGTPHWFKEVPGPLTYYVVKAR